MRQVLFSGWYHQVVTERPVSVKHIRTLLPLLFLVAGGSLVVGMGSAYLQTQSVAGAFFAEQLANAGAYEQVRVGHREYVVNRGSVFLGETDIGFSYVPLRLAYAKLLARQAPLLSIPGVSPDSLTEAANGLDELARELSAVQSTDTERDAVRDDLYPTDFLRSISNLERTRQAFLSTGSWKFSRAYDRVLSRALRAYANDLAAFRSGFQTSVPADVGQFAMERAIISRESMLEALGRLQAGTERLRDTVRARLRCFEGSLASCEPLPLMLAIPQRTEEPDLALAEAVRMRFKDAGWKGLDGPLIELSGSSCVWRKHLFLQGPVTPLYVGDLRLLPVGTFKDEPFVDEFAAQQIPYLYLTPVVYYGCVNTMPEYGMVGAVLAVQEFAMRMQISSVVGEADGDTLSKLEKKLSSERLVRESDALEYVTEARRLRANLPPEMNRGIDELELALRVRTKGLAELAQKIVLTERSGLALKEHVTQFDKSSKYLFYVRSGIFSLLLSHVVDSEIERSFAVNTGTKKTWPYVWYSELPRDSSVERDVVRSLSFFDEFLGVH